MRTSLFIALLIACHSFSALGQNLVVNGDFEAYNNCPYGFTNPQLGNDGINYDPTFTNFPILIGWVRPGFWNTPDYLNSCMPGQLFAVDNMGVPENFFGYQKAHSGNGYVGAYTYSAQNVNGAPAEDYRETISTRLIQSLEKDKEYCVTFFASPTAKSPIAYNMIAVYEIGANFSVDYPDSNTNSLNFPLSYDIMNPVGNYLTDTSQWYKISGIYKAKGGEIWMTIGCFRNVPAPPAFICIPPTTCDPNKSWWSYTYYDDVSVVEVPVNIARHDTSFCSETLSWQVSAGIGQGQYLWDNGETSMTHTITDTLLHWCVTYKDCSKFIDTFKASHFPIATPVVRDTNVCEGVIGLTISVQGTNIQWFTSLTDPIGLPVQPAINTNNTGTHTYYVASVNGACSSERVPVTITVSNTPEAELGENKVLCNDQPDTLRVAPHEAGVTYLWNTGDTNCCIPIMSDGIYSISAQNVCGMATDSISVRIINCSNCLLVPTAFSPNADEHNDEFGVIVRCPLKHFVLKIYNRFGELVFSSYNAADKWDGRYKGGKADVGVYMYFLEYRAELDTKNTLMKGDISLVR